MVPSEKENHLIVASFLFCSVLPVTQNLYEAAVLHFPDVCDDILQYVYAEINYPPIQSNILSFLYLMFILFALFLEHYAYKQNND